MSRLSQPARFLAVGAAGFAANVAAFAALHRAGVPYGAASVTAYLFSNLLMYLGNRYFTFRLGHTGFWTAYARYAAVGVVVAALTAAVLAFLVEVAGVGPTPGQVLAILAVTPVAFVLIKRWTFRVSAGRA